MKVLNPTDIGDQNKMSILRTIKENDGISRQEISKRLKLSAPAVSKNINALLETGIIREGGIDETSLGRKPIQLCYNADIMCVIGIELMPKEIRGGIADLYGNVMGWVEKKLSLSEGVTGVLNQLDDTMESLLQYKKEGTKVSCAAIGVPALTGQEDLNDLFATYLPEWNQVDLKSYIEEKYGMTTMVMNDVELALIGERAEGEGRNYNDILYIKYGDGFAARAVVDGHLLKGHNMAAGELGYYLEGIEQLSDKFVCPGRFEGEVCRRMIEKYNNSAVVDIQTLQNFALKNDAEAMRIMDKIMDKISVIISNTVLMLNSEVVILGGVASALTNENLEKIEAVLRKTCPFVPKVVISRLGVKAPVVGAVKVALGYAEKQLVTYWK